MEEAQDVKNPLQMSVIRESLGEMKDTDEQIGSMMGPRSSSPFQVRTMIRHVGILDKSSKVLESLVLQCQ